MADLSLSLRIASIFIVWTASAVGVSWPFMIKTAGTVESDLFRMLKSCAAGVMLGIALMHLLPDADEDLREVVPDYCLAFAVTAAGVVLNLTLEQMALSWLASKRKKKADKSSTEDESSKREPTVIKHIEHGEHCGFVKCEHGDDLENGSPDLTIPFAGVGHFNHTHTHAHMSPTKNSQIEPISNHSGKTYDGASLSEGCQTVNECIQTPDLVDDEPDVDEEEEMIANLMNAKSMRDMVSLYAMELSISVHSIIIGVDIGLLAGNSHIATLVSLLVAISFHQFVEGSGLGTILRTMRSAGSSSTKVVVFVMIFGMTTPTGIFIGIMTSALPTTPTQTAIKGAANALACGSLLYIALAEMVATYFTAHDLLHKPVLKMKMIAAFALGITAMAVIAIWA